MPGNEHQNMGGDPRWTAKEQSSLTGTVQSVSGNLVLAQVIDGAGSGAGSGGMVRCRAAQGGVAVGDLVIIHQDGRGGMSCTVAFPGGDNLEISEGASIFVGKNMPGLAPIGCLVAWPFEANIPDGWQIADGLAITDARSPLNGTNTFDAMGFNLLGRCTGAKAGDSDYDLAVGTERRWPDAVGGRKHDHDPHDPTLTYTKQALSGSVTDAYGHTHSVSFNSAAATVAHAHDYLTPGGTGGQHNHNDIFSLQSDVVTFQGGTTTPLPVSVTVAFTDDGAHQHSGKVEATDQNEQDSTSHLHAVSGTTASDGAHGHVDTFGITDGGCVLTEVNTWAHSGEKHLDPYKIIHWIQRIY